MDTVNMLEQRLLFRFYPFPDYAKFFLQAEGGAAVIFEEDNDPFRFSGGMVTGYRFTLGRIGYLEPSLRIGYPFFWGVGIAGGLNFQYEKQEKKEKPEKPEKPVKPKEDILPFKNRMIELSLVNTSIDLSNDVFFFRDFLIHPIDMISTGRIFHDELSIDIDDLSNGFKFDLDTTVKSFSLNFNWKNKWGFGFDIAHIDVSGNLSFSGNILTNILAYKEDIEEQNHVGGAIFVDAGLPIFFHVNKFKVKLRPAVYVPVLYTEPNIKYTYKSDDESLLLKLEYDLRVYSLVDLRLDDMDSMWQDLRDIPGNNFGYDLGFGLEYAWKERIDIGVDFVNIPVVTGKLYYYSQLAGEFLVDTGDIDFDSLEDEEKSFKDVFSDVYKIPNDFDLKFNFNSDGKKIYRPFKTLFYANYRPYQSRTVSFALIPSLGFSLNLLYPQQTKFVDFFDGLHCCALEGGLSARLDLANIFITTLGINYNDRKFKHSVDLAFNFRAFEVDVGLSMQARNFIKSFQGMGMGINAGIKLGW
jgi:hypothetical protein